jgi:hypothetical protein
VECRKSSEKSAIANKIREQERTRIVFCHRESTMLCRYAVAVRSVSLVVYQVGRPKAESLGRARDVSSIYIQRDVAWSTATPPRNKQVPASGLSEVMGG